MSLRHAVLVYEYPAMPWLRFAFLEQFEKFGGQRNPTLFVIFRNKIYVALSLAGHAEFSLLEVNVIPSGVHHFLFPAARVQNAEIALLLFTVHDLRFFPV